MAFSESWMGNASSIEFLQRLSEETGKEDKVPNRLHLQEYYLLGCGATLPGRSLPKFACLFGFFFIL
jgi:hypothetical protein